MVSVTLNRSHHRDGHESDPDHESNDHISCTLWTILILINMSAIMYGYVLIALNACLALGNRGNPSACYNGDDDWSPPCPEGSVFDDLNLSTTEAQSAVALVELGALLACLAGSKPIEVYGRRNILLWNNVFFITGAVAAASGSKPLLFLGRLISGFGVGITSQVAPVLASELANEAQRGKVTGLFPVFSRVGMLFTVLVGYGFVMHVQHGWQYVQAFAAFPALVQLSFSFMIPESPKWLICTKKDTEGARKVLMALRGPHEDIDAEIEYIASRQQKNEEENDSNSSGGDGSGSGSGSGSGGDVTWTEVFEWKKAIQLGVVLVIIQTQTGANSSFYYSSTIFGFAGFYDAILGSVIIFGAALLVTIISDVLVESLGRRSLLLGGTSVAFCALLTLSLTLWCGNSLGQMQGILAVLSLVVFVMGWGIGLGAVTWVVMAEIIPTRIRTKAYGLFVAMMWVSGFLDGFLTLTAIDGLGGVNAGMDDTAKTDHQKIGCGKLYFIYTFICAAAIVYMYYNLPETKGTTPEALRSADEIAAAEAARAKRRAREIKEKGNTLKESLISTHDEL